MLTPKTAYRRNSDGTLSPIRVLFEGGKYYSAYGYPLFPTTETETLYGWDHDLVQVYLSGGPDVLIPVTK